jgi:hypothetical protein
MEVAADEIVKLRAAVAAEREACAKECDKIELWTWFGMTIHERNAWVCSVRACAVAIRARGER